MSPFHFRLSAAKNLSSFQLLPASLFTDLLQLFLGLPVFLFPWGFQSSALFGISPSSFINVWPSHLNLLFLIYLGKLSFCILISEKSVTVDNPTTLLTVSRRSLTAEFPCSIPYQFTWALWWTKWHCPNTSVSPVSAIPPTLRTHSFFHHRRCITLVANSVFK